MQPVESVFAPEFEAFDHACVSLTATFLSLRRLILAWNSCFSDFLVPFVQVFYSCCLSQCWEPPQRAYGPHPSWQPPPTPVPASGSLPSGSLPSAYFVPSPCNETLWFSCTFFFFSSHSRPSNLSLCFYLALLFILNLWGFIICGLLWDISFIVDQVCKLQGSRIEGPRAVPTFLARMYLPWKGLLWGWSS